MGRCCVWELSQGETSTSGSWTTHINPIAETKNPFPMQKQKQRFPQNLFPFVLLHVPLRRGTTRIYPKAKEELYSLSSFISFQSIRLLLIFKWLTEGEVLDWLMSNLYNRDFILEFVGMETKLHPFDSVEDNELPSGKLKDLPRGIMHTRSDLELRPQWRKSLRSTDNQITGPWIAQGVLLVGKKVE
ncbi:uncharacterized protein LOC108477255 isoform X1 [Gossypium arboreum]|uniref:uncharacterized protein LOC108477255 isoform X1 n=1 Tax=Gossypium arboreum TaxID=29729 RepID=UPI0022F1C20D|nr:uncharacterized protein LOC108477255 isoform X1 [Gossypium arboreum]